MNFESALKAMREGKSVKTKNMNESICMITKIYYARNSDRPVDGIPEYYLMSEDWAIVNETD